MVTKEEFEKKVESRLVEMGGGYYRLYPDSTGLISQTEIYALELIGYEFIYVGMEDGKCYVVFERKESD